MRDYYRLSFPITSTIRKVVQKILLLIAIVLDIANVFVLIDVIYKSLLYLLVMVGLIVVSITIRLIALRLNYSYEYLMNDGVFRIIKAYTMKSRNVVVLDSSISFELSLLVENMSKGTVLYNIGTNLQIYNLSIGENRYLIALDDYMYALIDNLKEKNYDIS